MSTPQSSSLPQTMTPTVFPLAGVLILILSSWALSGLDASGKWKRPVVTEIVPAAKFFPAEDYHQDYLQKNPGGYNCHVLRD